MKKSTPLDYFAAVFHGRVVHYPLDARFVIEQRSPKSHYAVVAQRDDFGVAAAKYDSARRKLNMFTRLSFYVNGKLTKMLLVRS